ncbi:MAG: GNAT family N-acetyltransferase [Tardiphaga sp.]|uniref:GNAT family N-acetyltransferase n=1 Tax=Tardiphaga sp. TaxID=1926292 RepID=UPI0019A1FCCA|nr:GNAT family N-acetyltransferase [Tardiphaga sp.]MBC7584826.1 GNAT family N-acetyltransferase [Tardiphaga sp.]
MSWTLKPASYFADFADRWQALNADTLASPLLALDWVRPLLREFGSARELVACHEQDGQVTAMAILTPRGRGAWETFQPSQAPIGLWMHRPGVAIAPLTASLMRALPGFPLVLGLTQLDPDLTARPADAGRVRTLDYVQTARVTLAGSFEEYWAARGKNLRQNMKKQRNKLDKEGISTHLQCSTVPDDVAGVLADYGRLESAGWKADIGTAIHPDNAQGRFYQSMLEAFARRGAARMYRYWFGDRVVAMDLCIEGGDHLVILKTTYDESIKDGSSPAFLLRQDQFEQIFNEGRFRAIEFYGKVMDWHLKWTSEVRMLYHVNAYRFEGLAYLHGRRKMQQEAAAAVAAPAPVTPVTESKPE